MARDARALWRKRVARWRDSGLTAKEFAAETGVNANTLSHWGWKLRVEARRANPSPAVQFLEVAAPPVEVAEAKGLELILADGVRVLVPTDFDPTHLRRVVAALGER